MFSAQSQMQGADDELSYMEEDAVLALVTQTMEHSGREAWTSACVLGRTIFFFIIENFFAT